MKTNADAEAGKPSWPLTGNHEDNIDT